MEDGIRGNAAGARSGLWVRECVSAQVCVEGKQQRE